MSEYAPDARCALVRSLVELQQPCVLNLGFWAEDDANPGSFSKQSWHTVVAVGYESTPTPLTPTLRLNDPGRWNGDPYDHSVPLQRNLNLGPEWQLAGFGGDTHAYDVADIDFIVFVQDAAVASRDTANVKIDTPLGSETVPISGTLETIAFEPVRQNLTYLYTTGGEAKVGCYDRSSQTTTETDLPGFPTDTRQAIFDLERTYVFVLDDTGTRLDAWSTSYAHKLDTLDEVVLSNAVRLAMNPVGNRLLVYDQGASTLYLLAFDGIAFAIHDAIILGMPPLEFPSDAFHMTVSTSGDLYYTYGDTNMWLLPASDVVPVVFASSELADPDDVAINSSGQVLYVADQVDRGTNERVLRKFDATGKFIGNYGAPSPLMIWDELVITSAPKRQDLPEQPNMPPGFDALWVGSTDDWGVLSNWASTVVPSGPDIDVFVGAPTDLTSINSDRTVKTLFNAGTVQINAHRTLEILEAIRVTTTGVVGVRHSGVGTADLALQPGAVLTNGGTVDLDADFSYGASQVVMDPSGPPATDRKLNLLGPVGGNARPLWGSPTLTRISAPITPALARLHPRGATVLKCHGRPAAKSRKVGV